MSKALVLIDIQNDYFNGGSMELVGMEEATQNIRKLLNYFREKNLPVFHIRHIATIEGASFFLPNTYGCEINELVKPEDGEPIVIKHFPSSFRETELEALLRVQGVSELVLCGAMTHMCIDTTARAAFDLGFKCCIVSDACATRSLSFDGREVSADDVQTAFMSALSVPFAAVEKTGSIISA